MNDPVLERLPYNSWSRALYLLGTRVGVGVALGTALGLLPMPWLAVGLAVAVLAFFVFLVRTQLWLTRSRRELDEIMAKLEGRQR